LHQAERKTPSSQKRRAQDRAYRIIVTTFRISQAQIVDVLSRLLELRVLGARG
jgi:hypothetical protein